ncbi:hypothetical protein ELQ90_13155 [Labedella phragmitis]|uniref:Ferritin-like domain-containing protein n=1 Tax=Labedella phragmitis TaxID=2498849 RepID=A0A3S3Z1J7_9MICO|nr:ferritin-like fold-containing protein [Labedella phragmitis]RWZ49691.1 hypothetical protein ELQ90_13155 [Labedella phragmitis]
MASWFGRRGPRRETPRLRARGARRSVTRVEFTDLHPDPDSYLGRAARIQLGHVETLGALVARFERFDDKERLSTAAGFALSKHQAVVAEIERRDGDPAEAMAAVAPSIDHFRSITQGNSPTEALLSFHVTSGFLDDLFIGLAASLPPDLGPRIGGLLGAEAGTAGIVDILEREISVDRRTASFLAMWGRRLVGDTLLLAREVVDGGGHEHGDDVEPVFTELIAAHTRRMDALGLTA